VLEERGRQLRYLLRDRDAKFSRAFDDVVRDQGAEILVTPVRAPRANVYAERWIRTVRAECLDWLLIVGRGHLEQVLRVTSGTTTSTVRTERWDWKRQTRPPD
jgi:putative transposase